MRPYNLLLLAALCVALPTHAQSRETASGPIPTVTAKTASMKNIPGFVPLHWDAKTGHIFLEIHLDASGKSPDLLYTTSLAAGTGSNDLGLDRGKTSRGLVVHFERVGPKVLMVEPNQMFRSGVDDPLVSRPVNESFPASILYGFTVAADDDAGTILVDATDFLLHDNFGVTEAITRMKQGTYKVDATRSAIDLQNTKAFPENSVVESVLTLTTEGVPGRWVRDTAPDPRSVTIRERTSFVQLPPLDGSFVPRRFNPNAGYFDFAYRDYNVPLGDDMTQRFIERHRLIKKDPNCKTACVAVKPIQYYVDNGAPEPIRSALLEGARWWDQAFQAAGWAPGTFKVDILPQGADPMDVRYNIIQWVHRYTRGWSYGATISDPRTGEILKGNVTLGSLRGRQDYMIAEALLSPYKDLSSRSAAEGSASPDPAKDPMLQLVLQRIRQLAAHETGHTLGLAHNFAASTYTPNDHEHTLSVMEYPHPWVTLDANGKIDIAHAYPVGIGIWDKTSIDYGYREFDKNGHPVEDEAALSKILADSQKTGMVFLTDQDARPFSSASPIDHLWDNGSDLPAELDRVLAVRAAALKNFGENNIKPGEPLAHLEDVLVPLYLFHRYQTEATIKMIGGLDYRYNMRGDGQLLPQIVDPAKQKAALTAVLQTLTPQTLTLPESILKLLPPPPPGYPRNLESFPSHTAMTFDPIATAESAADLTLQVLFDPARASRLIEYHMRVPQSPSLRSVLEAVSKTTAERPEGGHSMTSEVERAVEFRGLEWMLSLSINKEASSQARAIALSHIDDLYKQWTTEPMPTDTAEAIHRRALIARIDDFKHDPEKFVAAKPIEAPPGMPIGDDGDDY
ncbi:DUF5117 domain-containing protein [Granulicella sp. 5B5]|uniref:zinc-dependent metalloprotease n=1 Tax=Granulicella sp. 5B5 TaxID=1617967 RepID=UPI0015F3D6A1|nr:zinc-dependent metalloprotease [Granulicella sp. 5B5]QMV18769.1 DUF5117 domain-containing protein [Granulicella sp. 5B5]